MLGRLAERGYEVVEEADQASVLIVNTCGFIRSAVEESIDTILQLAELKASGSADRLVVVGCLPQRYPGDLASSLPEVDLVCGTGDVDRLPDLLDGLGPDAAPSDVVWAKPGYVPAEPGPRLRSAPFFRAYLKIAEGCSNVCAYCLIPKLRGPLRSRPLPVLVEEARALARSGVKELILVAQDTTAYGRDLSSGETLAGLLRALSGVEGVEWLRIMYAYPSGLTDELIEVMAGVPKVLPYLDLPLQHASPEVLRRMHRDGDVDLLALANRLRRAVPGLTLRTTMMVGFPGETEADFEILADFTARARFDRLGVFKFSPEEGSPAARYPDQVPQRVKENRRRKIMAVQRRISRSINQALVGRIVPVLVEGYSAETDLLLAGRTQGQAPDIDGVVYITRGEAAPGEIRRVRITEAHDYDLVGELIENEADGPDGGPGFLDNPSGVD